MDTAVQHLRWFDEIGMDDVPLVGGKNASLGEMVRALAPLGSPRAQRFRGHRRAPIATCSTAAPTPGPR